MPESTASEKWVRDYALLALFVARRLGPRPRSVAAQDAAIDRASDALDADDTELAAKGRRFLAIEMVALSGRRRGGPTPADWEQAIATVDAADDAALRRWARGGMVLRAAQGGWADSGSEG